MHKNIWMAAMAAVFVLSACRTVEMDSQRVMTPPEMVRPAAIQATIKQVVLQNSKQGWMVEKSSKDELVVGLHKRSHYLQVTYAYSFADNKLVSKITDSRNLNQEGNQIHKAALKWKEQLDQQIFIATSQL